MGYLNGRNFGRDLIWGIKIFAKFGIDKIWQIESLLSLA